MMRGYILFFMFLVTFFLLSFFLVSAAVTITAPATNSNFTQSISTATCTVSEEDIVSATFYVNASGVGATSIASVLNTSVNQTGFSDSSVDVSFLDDASDYNLWCRATDISGTTYNSTYTAVSLVIDDTAPFVSFEGYSNATTYTNQSNASFTLLITDVVFGIEGVSNCFVNVNGTNQTTTLVNTSSTIGWCNTTNASLSGLSDGNRTVLVYVNDGLNNKAVDVSYVIQVDSTSPEADGSCVDDSVEEGETMTCNCSGTDATSGVANFSANSTFTHSNAGDYNYTCILYDHAGNIDIENVSYTITEAGSSSTPSNSGDTSDDFWTAGTQVVSDTSFTAGITLSLEAKRRARISVGGANHHVGIISLSTTTATINISSDPIQVVLGIGESTKADVTDDGFYDVSVLLNEINNSQANLTILKINEEVPETISDTSSNAAAETTEGSTGSVDDKGSGNESGSGGTVLIWVAVIFFLIAAIAFTLVAVRKYTGISKIWR